MGRAWPHVPGVPAAGHITSRGFWHPGGIPGCRKCEPSLPCDGKQVYPSRQQAERAARSIPTRHNEVLQPYHCASHNGWHLGHPRGFR